MDATQFKAAVQDLHGLLPEMVQEICTIADNLLPQELDTFLSQLKISNEKLLKNRTETGELTQGILTDVRALNKHVQGEVRKGEEQAEHEGGVASAEQNLTNL
jgi:c-di-GMP-related signal transduction protein